MDEMTLFALFLALIWGVVWAVILQFTRMGQFLVHQRTWITVVIGVGVDLAITATCVPLDAWWRIAAIVTTSSVGIIARSLINEWGDVQELKRQLGGDKD